MAVLDPNLLASIRVLLGEVGDGLSDTVLTDPLVGGAAETAILAAVGDPPYEERPLAEQDAIRAGVAYLTAARALRTTRAESAITAEKFAQQYSVTRQAVDLGAWSAELEREAWRAIAALRPASTTLGAAFFGTAPGRRGVF